MCGVVAVVWVSVTHSVPRVVLGVGSAMGTADARSSLARRLSDGAGDSGGCDGACCSFGCVFTCSPAADSIVIFDESVPCVDCTEVALSLHRACTIHESDPEKTVSNQVEKNPRGDRCLVTLMNEW